jgi:hypothetical protein
MQRAQCNRLRAKDSSKHAHRDVPFGVGPLGWALARSKPTLRHFAGARPTGHKAKSLQLDYCSAPALAAKALNERAARTRGWIMAASPRNDQEQE